MRIELLFLWHKAPSQKSPYRGCKNEVQARMAGSARRPRSGRTHIQPLGKCSTEPTPTPAVPSPFQNHGGTGLVSCEAEEQGVSVGALAQPAASWWLEQAAGLLRASVYTFIAGGFGLGYLQEPSASTTLFIHNPRIQMVNNSTVGWHKVLNCLIQRRTEVESHDVFFSP